MIDNTTFNTRTALYHTFGCKLNFAETSTVAQMMTEKGIRRVAPGEIPDIIVVNTCSVTEMADKKCRQEIRSLHRRYPKAPILVTGCYAQLKSEEVAKIEGVEIVTGSNQKLQLADYLDKWLESHKPISDITPLSEIRNFQPSCSRGDRTRFFLKVQDGCDYWCTYCTIPKARGRSRSGSIQQLTAQAEEVAAEGGKEIVITGVNIGDFGKGTNETFLDLIRALDKVQGIERFRISSIEPNLITDEIIEWCAQSRAFMPHFHIPLQSGSDEVLQMMHRHYGTDLFRHKIELIRERIPHAFIGVDLIVGARGETEELFNQSKKFVESLPISRLHVFPYSERPGTLALKIEHKVSQADKNKRAHKMLSISDEKLKAFSQLFVGDVRPVLLEHSEENGAFSGFTDNYLRVNVTGDALASNIIVPVKLESFDPVSMEFYGTLAK